MARLAQVTEGAYPSVSIRVTVQGSTRKVTALIDTGFDGYLVVPADLAPLGRDTRYRERVVTASGEVVPVPVFPATVEFADAPGLFDAMAIALGDEFLVGILSLNQIRLTLDHGRQVMIEP